MSIHTISATEASKTFSVILNKVHHQGEHFAIKRGKEIIAHDLIIAATAITHGYALLTTNYHEFSREINKHP